MLGREGGLEARAHEGGDAPALVQAVLDPLLIPLTEVPLAVLPVVAPEVGAQEAHEEHGDQHVRDPQQRRPCRRRRRDRGCRRRSDGLCCGVGRIGCGMLKSGEGDADVVEAGGGGAWGRHGRSVSGRGCGCRRWGIPL